MDGIQIHQKPAFRSLVLGVILGGIYVYNLIRQGAAQWNTLGIALDLVLLFLLFRISLFFYAQFIVPVRNLQDRLTISSRLWLHAMQAHGAAILVKDGRKVERAGESTKHGPGLLWVDSASAVIIRAGTNRRRILGPGVHFTGSKEKIESVFSLHTQVYTVGPGKDDRPFDKLRENASEAERKKFEALQTSRLAVSGRTRDGIEIIPNITVVFKLDADPAPPGKAGSRFGFKKESIEKAAQAEGLNAGPSSGDRTHVAWNQLPGLIAVDLWREYLAKFTLDELFNASFPAPQVVPQPDESEPAILLRDTPLIIKRNFLARFLRQRNNALEQWLDRKGIGRESGPDEDVVRQPEPAKVQETGQSCTALQIITQMVKARMTQTSIPILDECGRNLEGHFASKEYRELKKRGVAILNVSVGSLRFDPTVEEHIVQQWNTSWLANARIEHAQVEHLERLAAQSGRQRALRDHALALSRAIEHGKPGDLPSATKILLQSTLFEIVGDGRLYGRAGNEAESLSKLIEWVESGPT